MERRATGDEPGLVFLAGVVEGGGTLHPEGHGAAHYLDAADDLVSALALVREAYRHVVSDFSDAVWREEAGDEDVGVRPVELLACDPFRVGRDYEPPPFFVVKDGSEDARGVVARQA